jgi:histidine triad (HIT) family protein
MKKQPTDPAASLEPPPERILDPTCIFCKIITGELPSRRIYEDDRAIAFLDIAAWHRGHSLVVPKRHIVDLITGDSSLAEVAPAVDAVARMLMHRLAADGINFLSSAREAAGQEVFHMHVHVVPRYDDEPGLPLLVNRGIAPEGELDSVYRQIQAGD